MTIMVIPEMNHAKRNLNTIFTSMTYDVILVVYLLYQYRLHTKPPLREQQFSMSSCFRWLLIARWQQRHRSAIAIVTSSIVALLVANGNTNSHMVIIVAKI